jgi:lipopolysaccharide biosynthesis protein
MKVVAILAHIFWEDSWETMKSYFFNLKEYQGVESIFLINTCSEIVANEIRQDLPEAKIIVSENAGRDIGGILVLLDFYLKHKIYSDYMIITHDKKSNIYCFNALMTILHKDIIPIVLKQFERKSIGMIGTRHLQTLVWMNTNMLDILQAYCIKFGLTNLQRGLENPKYYGFIGGTIFCVRSVLFEHFFYLNSPLEIRLDVLKDYETAYVIERLFGYIVTNNEYSIISYTDKIPRLLL